MPRVLHVFGSLDCGGAEKWLLSVVGRDRDRAHEVCLLAEAEGALCGEFRREGVHLNRCPLRPYWSFPFRLARLLREGEFEVVHSHVFLFSGVILALAWGAGVPVRIAHSHNTSGGRGQGLLRRGYTAVCRLLLSRSTTIGVGCSEPALAALFRADLARASAGRLRVVPYGVHLSHTREPPRFADSAPVVIHVGSLTPQKNQQMLLRVFAEVQRQRPAAQLMIVGDGPGRAELERMIRSRGLNGCVRLMGYRSDVASLLEVSDAFVMTSRYEGSPLSLLEALSVGLPSVVPAHLDPALLSMTRLVRACALGDDPTIWARAVLDAVDGGRLPLAESHAMMRRAGRTTEQSFRRLEAVYRDGAAQTIAVAKRDRAGRVSA